MRRDNLILSTDSYKLGHWSQYPPGTEHVYSYMESRQGARFPYTVFFGLQAILKDYLVGDRVSVFDIEEAEALAQVHFGRPLFNREGWEHVARGHGGALPLLIKAVPEGTPVPVGNVLMTVENTDPKCYWLTNAVESLLTHVWYPSTVATLSRTTKEFLSSALERTADTQDALPFMLHDFGYRGASSHESAAIGGAAHLVNFLGTDTLPAMLLALDAYGANVDSLAFSVAATEHSVMTARGRAGEPETVGRLLADNPSGVLSVVADSYDIYEFVRAVGSTWRESILERDGVFVVRPDSVTREHPYPAHLVVWILETLHASFGGTVNSKGFRVLDPHVRVLWGDGIDLDGIERIVNRSMLAGFSAENLVFGMGGGLLQKVDRDTQRFAFKCSAQKRAGEWHDVHKEPLDRSKASKRGRLKLVQGTDGRLVTMPLREAPFHDDLLDPVFRDGELLREQSFGDVRECAALPALAAAVG